MNKLTRWFFIRVGVYAVLILFLILYPYLNIEMPCYFHQVTKLQCPTCGFMRSITALFHGDFAAAYSFSPLLTLFFAPLTAALLAEDIVTGLSRIINKKRLHLSVMEYLLRPQLYFGKEDVA